MIHENYGHILDADYAWTLTMNAPMNGRITEMAADPGNDIFAVVSIKNALLTPCRIH